MSFELSRPSRARRIALLDSLSIEIHADVLAGAGTLRLRHLDQLAALYVVAGTHGPLPYDRGAILRLAAGEPDGWTRELNPCPPWSQRGTDGGLAGTGTSIRY